MSQPPISASESWLHCLNAARKNELLPEDHLRALRAFIRQQDPPPEWVDKALEIAHTPGLSAAGWNLYWVLMENSTAF